MFGKFRQKRTSFHNVRVDSGSYLDMEVSTAGSINANNYSRNTEIIQENIPQRNRKDNHQSSDSMFASPFLETTWTSLNITLFIIYMIFDTFTPFYWSISTQIWDYPLTSISIQLSLSIIILFIYNILRFKCCFYSHPIVTSPTSSINLIKQGGSLSISNISSIFNSSRSRNKNDPQPRDQPVPASAAASQPSQDVTERNYKHIQNVAVFVNIFLVNFG